MIDLHGTSYSDARQFACWVDMIVAEEIKLLPRQAVWHS
jgi:hypothetical protein